MGTGSAWAQARPTEDVGPSEGPPATAPDNDSATKTIPIPRGQDATREHADALRDAYLARSRGLGGALAGWAAASMVLGATQWATADDAFTRGIGIQNLAWGGIDGILATIGLASSIGEDGVAAPAADWEGKRQTLETIYWVNFGLDVAYVTTGALLWGLGGNDDVRGAGAGVVLQGSFLFAYDFVGAMTMRLTPYE
ncbi:MAG: hypothetical protein AAF928_19115 [Myxococcota bacterium]